MVGVRLFATSRYRSTHIAEVHITALGLFFLIKQVFIYTIYTTYNKNRIYSSNPPTPQCVTSIVLVYEKYLHGLINFKH